MFVLLCTLCTSAGDWRFKQDYLTSEINPLIGMKSLIIAIKPSLTQFCADSTVLACRFVTPHLR